MARTVLGKGAVSLGLAALLLVGTVGCGDDHGSKHVVPPGSVDTADIAGTWNGTLTIAGLGDAFTVAFDCVGVVTGSVGGEDVSGQVTAFDPVTGEFSATMTIGNETRTLSGVVNATTLTGTFTSDSGPGGNFVVSFAAGSAAVCDFGVDVAADVTLTADDTTTCTSSGASPYDGAGSMLFTTNGAGGVNVAISLQGPPQIALIGTSDTTTNPISFTAAGLPDGAALTVTATIASDGVTLSGTFSGSNTDCSVLSGTFTGTFQ